MNVEEVIRENEPLIWWTIRRVRRYLPYGIIDFEDLYQRCVLHLLKDLPRHDPEKSSLATWFSLICRTATWKEINAASWQGYSTLIPGRSQMPWSGFSDKDGSTDWFEREYLGEDSDLFETTVDRLWLESFEPSDRQAVEMVIDGYSLSEVGAHLGFTEKPASKAQAYLAELLRERNEELADRELGSIRGRTAGVLRSPHKPRLVDSEDHCSQGHEWTAENIYYEKPKKEGDPPRRRCRACVLERSAKRYRKKVATVS